MNYGTHSILAALGNEVSVDMVLSKNDGLIGAYVEAVCVVTHITSQGNTPPTVLQKGQNL